MSFLKIGTRSRYALRFMIELAEVERAFRQESGKSRGYVKLRTVASSQEISWRYLEQIAPMLAEAGLVETVRGRFGGYRLLRNPETLSIAEILRVVESDEAPMKCFEPDDDCSRSAGCAASTFWKGLSEVVDKYLEGVTLQDLADGAHVLPELVLDRRSAASEPDPKASLESDAGTNGEAAGDGPGKAS